MNIDRCDVSRLDVPTRLPDLRRDIHVFVDYIRNREVKRAHRTNALTKADATRLAKLMSDPAALDEVHETGSSNWVAFVDNMTLQLGFVTYDTQGEYAGYTSSEPSYPDNYVEYHEKSYNRFLAMQAAKQEAKLFKLLLTASRGSESEFYNTGVLGQLDGFNTWGSATGVMPTLDFPTVRRFLLELLAQCPAGEWLSTDSLVEYLKEEHRYFLIPKKPRFQHKRNAENGRYSNFHESQEAWQHNIKIAETDEDAFERVEGRYIERFLEGIPLVLKYVDVAYAKQRIQTIFPSICCLKAFRVSERLRRALSGAIAEPRVTVTPSFDVYVQFEMYPASVLTQLTPLCELVSEDASIALKLTKQKIAAARAADPKLDAVTLLQRLSGDQLPANVTRELSDWSQHGEKFVFYPDGCVLEADKNLKDAEPFTVERVTPKVLLVHSPEKLFAKLERQELMPLRVKHGNQRFSPLPKNARTVFPKKSTSKTKQHAPKIQVTLMRLTRVQLICPGHDFFDELVRTLLNAKCPIETDRKNLMLTYSKQHESHVSNAIRELKKEYQIKIEDSA